MIKKIFLLIIILGLSWRVSQQRSLSMRFVDEDDHLAGADIINQGYKLYEQISTNHQPLVYSASAAIQKIARADNLLMLIRRHRQAMFGYGALWSLLLVLRFRWPGLIFVLFFEFLKYGLLGNLLLMESLAVYPAVYLLFVRLFTSSSRVIELLFLGFCVFLIFFNLVPLYPWLAVILLLSLPKIRWILIGFVLPTIILFYFYSPFVWFREIIYNNWQYAVPALNMVKTGADWLKIIFFPFTAYFSPDLQAKFISLFFTGYLTASFFNRKLLWLYPLLLLANNRVLSPAAAYYEGFHLLPWLGILIVIFVYSLKFLPAYFRLGFGIWSLVLLVNPAMPYFQTTDPNYEYYVNYSTTDDFRFAVRQLARPGDRLAVTAFQPLVGWQTNTNLATRQLVYYAWQSGVPELKTEYKEVFSGNNPPEIIYGNNDPTLLAEKYVNILKFGQPTELFIRADRFAQITDSQWAALLTRGLEK